MKIHIHFYDAWDTEEFKEQQHPRKKSGEFAPKGGAGGEKTGTASVPTYMQRVAAESNEDLKPLIRKKTPKKGFHMTEPKNLLSIAEHGLRVNSPRLGDPDAVFFNDDLYSKDSEESIEAMGSDIVTLEARIPPEATAYDDQDVRNLTGASQNPNSEIGENTAFFIQQGVAPENLYVVSTDGKRKRTPLLQYVKTMKAQ